MTTIPDLDAIEALLNLELADENHFARQLVNLARAQQQRIAELEAALGKFAETVHKTNAIPAELGHDHKIEQIMAAELQDIYAHGDHEMAAKDILTALDAAGLAVLPKEATEEMLQRGGRLVALWADQLPQDSDHEELVRDCWDAMLQAILDEQKETAPQ